jgi:hypothetical protein
VSHSVSSGPFGSWLLKHTGASGGLHGVSLRRATAKAGLKESYHFTRESHMRCAGYVLPGAVEVLSETDAPRLQGVPYAPHTNHTPC